MAITASCLFLKIKEKKKERDNVFVLSASTRMLYRVLEDEPATEMRLTYDEIVRQPGCPSFRKVNAELFLNYSYDVDCRCSRCPRLPSIFQILFHGSTVSHEPSFPCVTTLEYMAIGFLLLVVLQ